MASYHIQGIKVVLGMHGFGSKVSSAKSQWRAVILAQLPVPGLDPAETPWVGEELLAVFPFPSQSVAGLCQTGASQGSSSELHSELYLPPQVPETVQGDEAQGTEKLVPADPEGPAVPAYKDTPHHSPRPQV